MNSWISEELSKLRNRTLVLIVIVFALLGILVGFYLYANPLTGPFRNIAYAKVNGTGMHIEWETKVPTRTKIQYGTSTVYLNETDLSDEYDTSHKVELRGLLPEKLHTFRLIAEDSSGQRYTSSFFEF